MTTPSHKRHRHDPHHQHDHDRSRDVRKIILLLLQIVLDALALKR
jgi:hypothetical protein